MYIVCIQQICRPFDANMKVCSEGMQIQALYGMLLLKFTRKFYEYVYIRSESNCFTRRQSPANAELKAHMLFIILKKRYKISIKLRVSHSQDDVKLTKAFIKEQRWGLFNFIKGEIRVCNRIQKNSIYYDRKFSRSRFENKN